MAITVEANEKELIKDENVGRQLWDEAFNKGISFSALLEEKFPTLDDKQPDAFERQLALRGIVTCDMPEKGIYASKGNLFFQSNMPESRVLFPEFIDRTIRSAMMDQTDYMSYLCPKSNWEYDNTNVFRHFYLDDSVSTRQAGRRAEGATGPKITASWSEKAVNLKDFSIELDMSYEFVMNARLPIIQKVLQRVAIQKRLDEASEAITTIESGDGLSKEGAAAGSTNMSTLGTSAHTGTGDLEYKAWLKWIATFFPYQANVVLGYQTDIVDYVCVPKPTADPAFLYSLLDRSQLGGTPRIVNLGVGNVAALQHPDIATNKLLAIDNRWALMGYRNTGMDLVETDRIITSKFQKVVISNKVFFAKIFAAASKKLVTNA